MSVKERSHAAKFLERNASTVSINIDNLRSSSNAEARLRDGTADNRAIDNDTNLYMHLRNRLQKVTIDEEDLYIAEGDTLLDEAQLEIYALQKQAFNQLRNFENISDAAGLGRVKLTDTTNNNRGLLGMTQGGKFVRWNREDLEKGLTYCILRTTFTTGATNYDLVRESFKKATEAWEATCGVKFNYKSELDNKTNTDPGDLGVKFVVREFNANGKFIASAFFPNDPVYRRRILIDPSYYSAGSFDKVGVLRHELGHVLGFRHEHIRVEAPDPCYNEDITDVVDLTAYDSRSVMHYLCGGAGDPHLRITSLDKEGAQKLYGPPFNDIMSIE
jgi:hypothetical protein